MYAFNYRRAGTLDDAAKALAQDADAKVLAGGQSLIAAMKLRLAHPSQLIDLGSLPELRSVRVESGVDGGNVVLGAMATHAAVAVSGAVQKAIPALAELAGDIGDRQVRNMGTLGGSIANNDPAADYPAACLGLGATIVTTRRSIPADDFFRGLYETALEQGELITAVSFPAPKRAAYMKFKNPASRFALVGVFVAETQAGVRVAVTGAASGVFRVAAMERALEKKFAPESVAGIQVPADDLNSDIHAQADYRAHLITVMAGRAVRKALGENVTAS
jgi:carbon-monoxide dehydrogenase medium subunit